MLDCSHSEGFSEAFDGIVARAARRNYATIAKIPLGSFSVRKVEGSESPSGGSLYTSYYFYVVTDIEESKPEEMKGLLLPIKATPEPAS
jgi:hypothetical protein